MSETNRPALDAWVRTTAMTAPETARLAADLEAWGYDTLWFPEILGREAFVQAGWLLANTSTLRVATGIANIYLRDPHATSAAALTLAEQSGGRFTLGLGCSHSIMVEGLLGRDFTPASDLERYVDTVIANSPGMYDAPLPAKPVPIALAALGPRLVDFAAQRRLDVHTYLTTPEHTADARRRLGADIGLHVETKVLVTDDPERDRYHARQACAFYLSLASYQKSMLRHGFTDADLADGGSDRLIDSLVAIGDVDTITARIAEFEDAGATRVCVQTIDPDRPGHPHIDTFRLLAEARTATHDPASAGATHQAATR